MAQKWIDIIDDNKITIHFEHFKEFFVKTLDQDADELNLK